MNIQSVLIYIAIVLGAVVAVGAANAYVTKPLMDPQLPVVSPLPAGETQGHPAVNSNIVAASLEKIQAAQGADGGAAKLASQSYEPRKVKRNSFLWPGEEVGEVDAKGAPIDIQQPPMVLRLVFVGEKKKVAVINDSFLMEGDSFRGDQVQKIEKNTVILKGSDGVTTRLTMGEMTYAHLTEELLKKQEMRRAARTRAEEMGASGAAGAAKQEAVEKLMERLMPLMSVPASAGVKDSQIK